MKRPVEVQQAVVNDHVIITGLFLKHFELFATIAQLSGSPNSEEINLEALP